MAGLARFTGIGATARSGYNVSLWLELYFDHWRLYRAGEHPMQVNLGYDPIPETGFSKKKKWTGVDFFFLIKKKSGKILIGPDPAQWHSGNRN